MKAHRLTTCLATLLLCGSGAARATADPAPSMTLEPAAVTVERDGADALPGLREAAAADPRDRRDRFELVRGLSRAGLLEEALTEARAWREHDAYNLVVVRLIGDLLSELGREAEAKRVYSAVVELLPDDPAAHRALATVMKQAGDLEGAYGRLVEAVALSDADPRMRFELADAAQRTGRTDLARAAFEAIVVDTTVDESVTYPARQRLGQLLAEASRAASGAVAAELQGRLAALGLDGGVDNDIKIFLTWDTDRSDVDLHVKNPAGDEIDYQHKEGRFGERLFGDVTTGYGPESFTAKKAAPGTYEVLVNFYSVGGSDFGEARGEVVVVLHEGTAREARHVLPYRLVRSGQTVTVAYIHVAEQEHTP